MTPERASEILNAHTADGSYDAVIAAILAACREERRAALMEAADCIRPNGRKPRANTDCRMFWDNDNALADAILVLRDKDQP